MKRIKQDQSGQGSMLSFFIGAMIAVIIALQVAWPVIDTSIYGGDVAASNTLTLSGNATCGDKINITTVAGLKVNMVVNMSLGCAEVPAGSLNVTITEGRNGTASGYGALNISGAINTNSTLNAVMSAINTSNGVITLKYKTTGSAGNSVITTETMTNGAFSSGTLLHGIGATTANMSTAASTLIDQIPLFLVLVLLMIFVRAVI